MQERSDDKTERKQDQNDLRRRYTWSVCGHETRPSGVDKPVHSKKNCLNDAREYCNAHTHL